MVLRRALLGLVLLAVLASAWWFLRPQGPQDEAEIRALLHEAAQAASWGADVPPLERLSAAGRLAALCTRDVEVYLDFDGGRRLRGMDEIRQAATMARTSDASVQVDLGQLVVSVEASRTNATGQFVASVRAGPGEPTLQELRVRLRRENAGWRIARIEPVRGFGM